MKPTAAKAAIAGLSSIALSAGLIVGPAQAATTFCMVGTQVEFENCWTSGGDEGNIAITADITLPDRLLTTSGKVRKIDLNGKKLKADKGIQVATGDKLIVEDKGVGGSLEATVANDSLDAVIGGNGATSGPGETAGVFELRSGEVAIEADNIATGIGGGSAANGVGGAGGNVTIAGGTLNVQAYSSGVGIGGGIGLATSGAGGSLTVNDGVLTVSGGNQGAGIGGGTSATNPGSTGGVGATVVINGGEVTAEGGGWAPAIGGGAGQGLDETTGVSGGDGGSVTVNGGTLVATGGSNGGPGIGGGGAALAGDGGSVTVNGGTVTATGGSCASGIGGGTAVGDTQAGGDGATVNITGGEVKASGGDGSCAATPAAHSGAGIGSGVGFGSAGAVGSLIVAATKVPGSQTTGGQGGTNTAVPDITFSASPTKEATVEPLAGVIPPRGSFHVTFEDLPDPTPTPTPDPIPAAKSAQHLRAGAYPKRIKFRGLTLLNQRKATTKEGRPVVAKVKLTMNRGEVRCARIVRGKQRKLAISTYGECTFRVTVTYRAAGNAKLKSLTVVKKYRVKR